MRFDDQSILFVDDGQELVQVDGFVALEIVKDVGVVHQFNDFFLVHGFSQLSGHLLELFQIDVAVSVLVVVTEDLGLSLRGFGISNMVYDQSDELFEVDRFSGLSDSVNDIFDDLISALETEFFHSLVDFGGIDGSATVLVESVEGGLKVFEILLTEFISSVVGLGPGLLSA